jgi:hypothetical protein
VPGTPHSCSPGASDPSRSSRHLGCLLSLARLGVLLCIPSQEPVRAGCFFHENSSREGGPLVNAVKQRALLGFSLAGKVPCSQLTPLARSGVPYVVAASSHKESPFSNALPSILHVIETASNSSKFTTTAWKPPTYMSALLSRSKPESTCLEQIG